MQPLATRTLVSLAAIVALAACDKPASAPPERLPLPKQQSVNAPVASYTRPPLPPGVVVHSEEHTSVPRRADGVCDWRQLKLTEQKKGRSAILTARDDHSCTAEISYVTIPDRGERPVRADTIVTRYKHKKTSSNRLPTGANFAWTVTDDEPGFGIAPQPTPQYNPEANCWAELNNLQYGHTFNKNHAQSMRNRSTLANRMEAQFTVWARWSRQGSGSNLRHCVKIDSSRVIRTAWGYHNLKAYSIGHAWEPSPGGWIWSSSVGVVTAFAMAYAGFEKLCTLDGTNWYYEPYYFTDPNALGFLDYWHYEFRSDGTTNVGGWGFPKGAPALFSTCYHNVLSPVEPMEYVVTF